MELVKATEKRGAFLNLASLYGYEASLAIPAIGRAVNGDGMYVMPAALAFANGEKEAYVVMESDKAVGICGFTEREDGTHVIDELFVVKAYRAREFFDVVLSSYIEDKLGTLECHILKAQADVQALFEEALAHRGLIYGKTEMDAMAYLYTVPLLSQAL